MEALELRLLRCFLGGSRESGRQVLPKLASDEKISGRGADEFGSNNGPAGSLEGWIREVLVQIEGGFYSEALASRWWSVLLGEFPSLDLPIGNKSNVAKEFYDFVESRISAFLSLEREDGSEKYVQEDEGERRRREVLVLAFGVVVLCAFVQANMTGPTHQQFLACPAHAALSANRSPVGYAEQEWDAWARAQLMVDGCDILGKISLPQYLIMAKFLLVHPVETMVKRDELDIKGSRSRRWWAFRVLLMQQRVLAERSSSLRSLLVTASLDMIKYFGTTEAVGQLGYKLDTLEANSMVAAAHLEIGLMEHIYGHDDAARQCFERAGQSCGLEIALTGVLGFRTQYQIDPKAQMVLVASSQSSAETETNWLEFLDNDDEDPQDTTVKSEASDVHLAPKLVDATNNEENENGMSISGGQQILNSIEQAIILAMGVDVMKSNPDDELRSWQMAPFIEAVDNQHRSHPMVDSNLLPYLVDIDVRAWCQLLRIRWEKTRARTRERCFLMMEQLASDTQEGSVKVSQRMLHVLCVPFPILPALLKEYADLMVGFGLVGDAMKVYEELELWNNLIDCYCLLGKKTAAAGLIRQRLEVQPNEPRLWCSLGDVTMDDDCYHKAWEVSGHRFTRAQRSLARTAYNKGQYLQAIKHWDLALSLNPLHPDGWFALGSAALKARDLDKALVAFTRQVQLDPENGESWNNIAAINMQKKRSKEAFVAFREALKLKRNSWQIWENFGQVALDIANFGQAVLAVEKVLDLSEEKHVDVAALTTLMEEIEVRKGLLVRPTIVPKPDDRESESEDLENVPEGNVNDPWASLRVALPSVATTNGEELSSMDAGDPLSSGKPDGSSAKVKETEMLLEKVGKLLSRIVAKGSGGGEVWGLKARWHRLVGDMPMCIEALLKQVRAHQGSKWQNSPEQFQIFASACLQLCEVYVESASHADGKRELFSAQMLLRNTIKQAENFKSYRQYNDLVSCLDKVEMRIHALTHPGGLVQTGL